MQATGMGSKAQGALAWRLILGAALLVGQVAAQVQTDGVFPHSPIDKVLLSPHAIYMLPHQDNEAMVAEVVREEAQGSMKPYKFASGVPFEIDISRDGVWSVDPSGTARVWRAKVESPGAITMSLIFSDFYLPPNSELYVSSETESLGAFTGALNNKDDGQFSTLPIEGESLIIEYWEAIGTVVPEPLKRARDGEAVRLRIQNVVHGFRKGIYAGKAASGSCNVDVACAEGNPYRDQINSVGVFITDGGTRFCSGAIINNAKQDGRQLFLTAKHCLFEDTRNFIVGFDYQYSTCTSSGESPRVKKMNSVQGLTLLASWAKSDVALFEIVETIPDNYNVFYAGWSRRQVPPRDVTGIHHPSGDYKKISRFYGQTVLSSFQEGPRQYHWRIPKWSIGITEPGSSGSPLFDDRGRIVGHLHGGTSSCQHRDGFDAYGALAFDWSEGPSDSNRVNHILDPEHKGVQSMGGSYFKSTKKGPVAGLIKANVLMEFDEAIEPSASPSSPPANMKPVD